MICIYANDEIEWEKTGTEGLLQICEVGPPSSSLMTLTKPVTVLPSKIDTIESIQDSVNTALVLNVKSILIN